MYLLCADWTLPSYRRLSSRFWEAIDPDTKNVLLDLSHVDFIDSSCLGALVSILKSVNGQGELALVFTQ
ncbi:anti-sigma F factor antagonist (spoIIAA-2) [Klebsiella variicola]|uniref:Anti-sigma F factor antagonist (SpoIIAA-2) n=1 Tax=Klebsiella variicola TaxID=244366 RepID=A0A7H4MGZ9_KLEVA|nr:anti-sigma F factor antagonist (spoIIAA-2) [Klebsiella variicola]